MGHVINAVDITADHSEAVDVAVAEEDGVGDIPSHIHIKIIQNPINTIKINAGIIEASPEREDGKVEVEVSTTKKLTTKRFRNVQTPQTSEIKIYLQNRTINHAITITAIITTNKQAQNRSYAGTATVPIM